jgi:hypothetical protein
LTPKQSLTEEGKKEGHRNCENELAVGFQRRLTAEGHSAPTSGNVRRQRKWDEIPVDIEVRFGESYKAKSFSNGAEKSGSRI